MNEWKKERVNEWTSLLCVVPCECFCTRLCINSFIYHVIISLLYKEKKNNSSIARETKKGKDRIVCLSFLRKQLLLHHVNVSIVLNYNHCLGMKYWFITTVGGVTTVPSTNSTKWFLVSCVSLDMTTRGEHARGAWRWNQLVSDLIWISKSLVCPERKKLVFANTLC